MPKSHSKPKLYLVGCSKIQMMLCGFIFMFLHHCYFLFCDINFSILPNDPIFNDISNQPKLKLGNLIRKSSFLGFHVTT